MDFVFNTDNLYRTLAIYTKTEQRFSFNDLIGRKVRYIPANKIGTIKLKGQDLELNWDDGWRVGVILTTEYGQDFMRKSEVLPISYIPEKSIKLTIVADQKSIDIRSNDFTFSLLRGMYIIDDAPVDGIGCQVNNELDRYKIEKLCNEIAFALKEFLG